MARKRRRRLDGRTTLAMKRALEAAVEGEAQDREYLDLLAQNLTYTDIATKIGRSRQRATFLVNRALIRQMLLREHRAGKSPEEIARMMEKLKGA